MAIRIVFDYPGHQIRHSLARLIAWLCGALLVLLGLLATVVAIPSGFVTIGDVVAHLQRSREEIFPREFPLREIELAFALSVTLAIAGLRYGRRLVRGRRTVVLFLRRFGLRGSMQVVSYAVANTIGSSWRTVTLDDAAIAPLGVDASTRLVFGIGERLTRLAIATGKGVMVGFQWAVSGMWIVVALQVAVVWPNWKRLMTDGTADAYAGIFRMLMERQVPSRYFTPTLSGAFAILGTAAGFLFAGLLIVFFSLIALFPLFGFVILATSSAEALRKAEQTKTDTIGDARHVADVTARVTARGREMFASRLVVVRVAGAVWQQTVAALASATAATIIDISELTDNVVWELDEIERLCPGRCILIGDHTRIARWTTADDRSFPSGTLEARAASLLDGREVIAYTTDRKGMRRFARALYGVLIDVQARASE